MARSSLFFLFAFCCMYSCSSAPIDQDNLVADWPKVDKAPCDLQKVKADIVFVWDSSGSLSDEGMWVIYEYILAFTRSFKYGPDAVQTAMVVYEEKVTQTIRFNEAKTYEEFKKLVDERGVDESAGNKAGIDDAYRVVLDEIFNEKNGSRRNVPRLVVHFPLEAYTGPNPAARAALLRQQAELFVVSMDSKWQLNNAQLIDLAGDWSHVYQYNEVNIEDTLPASLVLATWRAACDAAANTYSISFVDTSTAYNSQFNVAGSTERKALVQHYVEKLSSVLQHSALHTAVIDVIDFGRSTYDKTGVTTKVTFGGFMGGLEESRIQTATEYLVGKENWEQFKAIRLTK